MKKGIENCLAARRDWERTPLEKRAEVFWRAAELMKEKYRYDLLATTMLGQVLTDLSLNAIFGLKTTAEQNIHGHKGSPLSSVGTA